MISNDTIAFPGETMPFKPTYLTELPSALTTTLQNSFGELGSTQYDELFFGDMALTSVDVAEDQAGKVCAVRLEDKQVFTQILTDLVIVDFTPEGEQVGLCIATCESAPQGSTQPYVGWNETFNTFKGKQAAGRRLKYMNQLGLREAGLTLRSSAILEDEAIRVWQKLEAEGVAEEAGNVLEPYWQFKQ